MDESVNADETCTYPDEGCGDTRNPVATTNTTEITVLSNITGHNVLSNIFVYVKTTPSKQLYFSSFSHKTFLQDFI